jgi:HSP20 family protein
MVRWDPFSELPAMRREMDRLLTRQGEGRSAAQAPWLPVSDVIEKEDAFVITVELPGVKDEDIDISVADGFLTIRGTRSLEETESTDRLHRIERSYGGFERSFRLPQGVEDDDIHAGVAYGVLKVTVPKRAVPEPRRIAVNDEAA